MSVNIKEMHWRTMVKHCLSFKEISVLVDLSGLVEAGKRSESIGPIIDLTLYRDKGDALAFDLALLEAANEFVSKMDKIVNGEMERLKGRT